MRWWVVALLIAALALAGCSAPPTAPNPHPSPFPRGEGATAIAPAAQGRPLGVVEEARADLARRLGVPVSAVDVVSESREAVPLSALRCGQSTARGTPLEPPGQIAATEIVLRAAGREYTYYAQGARLIVCEGR